MATVPDDDIERTKWSPWAIAAAVLLLMLFSVIAIGIVRGCFYVDPKEAAELEEKKKKDKKKKEEFVIAAPVIQPAEAKSPFQYAKPGHWATASQRMQANYREFIGDSRLLVTDRDRNPYPTAETPFVIRSRRPVLLTKGRPKVTESTFFVPQTTRPMHIVTRLEDRGLGMNPPTPDSPIQRMPSYQYHFVVLAKESTRYGYVKTLDSVKVPFDGESEADETEDPLHYRVVLMPVRQSIALSDNPLTWTSIAYMLWDEVDPQLFTPEQERAILDWLHWGGQLLVSGPDSLDTLKGSFLEEYLPATSEGPRTITAADPAIAEFNQGWLIDGTRSPAEPLQPTAPWSAVKLKPHEQARPIPNTGELFFERQVGRGRIVVSAVQLAERDLVNWRSGFESFFNAALLRRPPREYKPGYFGDVTLAWADPELAERRLDARLTTQLRYLARDLGVDTAYRYEEVKEDPGQFNGVPGFPGQPQVFQSYRPPEARGGIGAWNDFSETANAARSALRQAAGVEVPNASFVVFCLATYLVALVPLNWIIFHTLGRVEWAWVAAPLIAILGTVIIVQRAQLDIGFVRAQTEIGLLEQQPGHPRAHLSRYTALYTSLSTTYDLEFSNLTSLAAPFPADANFEMLRGQNYQEIDFQRYDNVQLAGVPISSNSTGMIHSEQMLALDGGIRLGKSTARRTDQVENRTKFALHSACVVRRPTREEVASRRRDFEGRWFGEMLPGASSPLPERMIRLSADKPAFAEERLAEERVQHSERLNLEPMFRLALDPKHMEEGEVRFVARIDEILPGETITPGASQQSGATLVVAHLQYAPLPPPRPDVNTRQDIKKAMDESPNSIPLSFAPQ